MYLGRFLPPRTGFRKIASIQDYIPDFPKDIEIDFMSFDFCCTNARGGEDYYQTHQGVIYNSGVFSSGRELPFTRDVFPSVSPSTWGDLLRTVVHQLVNNFLNERSARIHTYESPVQYYIKTANLREWFPEWVKKGRPLAKETPPWIKE